MKQNTPEWLEMRKKYIGASDAPVVMGISPWKSKYELWEEKVSIRMPQTPDMFVNEWTQRGIAMEPIARKEFIDITGIEVSPEVVFHQTNKWMMASLDGLSEDKKHAVEIKCPGNVDHSLALNNMIPEKYMPQLQHQMEVCGLEMIFYFSFNGSSGKIIEVRRDQAYIDKLVNEEKAFWKCVENFEPPELTEKNYIERNDFEWSLAAKNWEDNNKHMKILQERDKRYRDSLIKLSKGRNCQGSGITLSRVLRKGNVDYKAIPELQGVDLEKHRGEPIETWRLTNA